MALSIGAVSLPVDLLWSDEHEWSAVTQKQDYSLTGALILQEGIKLAGRPITLVGDERYGWATRAQVDALRALSEMVDATHVLILPDARTFNVRFARPAYKARPILPYNVSAEGDFYVLTVFLIQV